MKTIEEALSFIHGRQKFKKSPTLNRMREMMRLLGNPQDELKIIHVTGTNGKGSTVADLRTILQTAGLQVGTFTSPFITCFNERISINGQMISDEALLKTVQTVKPIVDQLDEALKEQEGGPTEFEIVTALMFVYFAQQDLDYVIVEVGIGGLYDSTNIIETPVATIITNVGFDHQGLLGNTLAEIAIQKAGILKEKCPLILGEVDQTALAVITQQAKQLHVPVYQLGKDFKVTDLKAKQWGETFNYQGLGYELAEVTVSLVGPHQIKNASLALTTALLLDVKPTMIKPALNQVHWAGRFERMQAEPLIFLDGAHNLPGIKALKELIKTRFADKEITLLVAILADKNVESMLGELISLPNVKVVLTTFNAPRKTAELQGKKALFPPVTIKENWQSALKEVIPTLNYDKILIITGSLYFVSEVRKYFSEEE